MFTIFSSIKKSLLSCLAFLSMYAGDMKSEYVFACAGSQGKDVRLTLVKGDITQQKDADFIVNAANQRLLGGGGVDGAIHDAAGAELSEWIAENIQEIKPNVRLETGQAVATPSFELKKQNVKNIIHTVGPDCRIAAQNKNREQLLASAYRNSLQEASKMARILNYGGLLPHEFNADLLKVTQQSMENAKIIAFPSISTAIYAYPIEEAARVAIETVFAVINKGNFGLQEVRFVLFSDADLVVYQEALQFYMNKHIKNGSLI